MAAHFNRDGHAGVGDMKVMALLYEANLVMRKLKEQKMIARLGCFLGRGMNTDFRFPSLVQD